MGFRCGFVNLRDRALKENVQSIADEEPQPGKDQIGFVAPRAGQRAPGRDHVQDEEPGRERIDGSRLSKALRGPVGRGEEAFTHSQRKLGSFHAQAGEIRGVWTMPTTDRCQRISSNINGLGRTLTPSLGRAGGRQKNSSQALRDHVHRDRILQHEKSA